MLDQTPPHPTATQVAMAIVALLDASRRPEVEDGRLEAYHAVATYLAHIVAQHSP